jgi:hypothetical protein
LGGTFRRTPWDLLALPKATKHYVTVPTNKNVLRLEVSMDDTRCMQALDALNDFDRIETALVMAKSAPPRQLRRKVTTGVKVLR